MLCLISLNEKIKKAVKGIGVIKKLNVTLLCSSLLTIYKSFIRPPLDYGDVIYDQLVIIDNQKKLNLFSITQH